MWLQHANNAGKLQQLSNKIDTDIANLKTVFEQYRNDVLKYAGGKLYSFEHTSGIDYARLRKSEQQVCCLAE